MFYSLNDLGNYCSNDRINTLLKKNDNELDIDDLLELNEALIMMKHFKQDIKNTKSYNERLRLCQQKLYRNFPQINNDNIAKYFKQITVRKYRTNFFEMIENLKKYTNLSSEGFDQLIKIPNFSIIYIMPCKNLLNIWGNKIYQYLVHEPVAISIVLNKYIDPANFKSGWYLPKEIDNSRSWQNLVEIYINYPGSNVNVLENIAQAPNVNNFKLSDYLKYKAKKKVDRFNSQLLKRNTGIKYTTKVIFSNDEQWLSWDKYDNEFKVFVSKKWIDSNLDYPTLLNNFIYFFGLTDTQFRSTLVSLRSQNSPLELLFHNWTTNSYENNAAFEARFSLQRLYMQGYYHELLDHNIRIEQICEWFFNTYISEEFNINGFKFNAPSSDSKYLEKCRGIFSEIDNVIKQFNLFSATGFIDQDLLNFGSTPIDISNVKSLILNKYVYVTKNDGSIASDCLFSDQHFIGLAVRYKSKNFFEAILNHKLEYSQIEEIDKAELDYLIEHHIVYKKKNILSLNKDYVGILKEIYDHGEFETEWYTSQSINPILTSMKEDHLIRYGNTLLSEPEIDFYYYICNSKKFTNGLDLRNKYIHGYSTLSEEENESNFYIILLILIQLIIRINEELCWYDEKKKQ